MKYRVYGLALVVAAVLAGCTSGPTSVGSNADSQAVEQGTSELPISQLLVSQEDFSANLSKVDESEISEFDSALDGLFPYKCPGITNELLSYVDKSIVKFSVPTDFADATRNNNFNVIQEVFRFDTPADAEKVLEAVQVALSSDCYFNGSFTEFVTNFEKLTLSDGPFAGFTWGVEQSQTPSALCGAPLAVFRNTYWAHISNSDVYVTQAKGAECFDDPENSFYRETVNAAKEAVASLGR